MTKYVSISMHRPSSHSISQKYVKQTYDALSNNNINLEFVASQISQLPIREQQKFLRLLLNYIEFLADSKYKPKGYNVVELAQRLIDVVNDYYFEQDEKQMALEGM